jgi:hypothetical protein
LVIVVTVYHYSNCFQFILREAEAIAINAFNLNRFDRSPPRLAIVEWALLARPLKTTFLLGDYVAGSYSARTPEV